MRDRLKIILLTTIFIVSFAVANAQDIHFSQVFSSPLFYNPGQTGLFNSDFRFVSNNKDQWRSVSTPYTSFSLAADMQLHKRKYNQDMFGIGILANRDQAGDSKYTTSQVYLSLSYIKALNKRNNHYLGIGTQIGYAYKSIDYSVLTFDNQWNGYYHDIYASTGETFNTNGFHYLDINVGVYWVNKFAERKTVSAGLAVSHINTPNHSFLESTDVNLDMKILLHFNGDLEIADALDFLPSVFIQQQGKYREFLIGSQFRIISSKNPYFFRAIRIGGFLRWNDAVVLLAGVDYQSFTGTISYDINVSTLKVASQVRGGIELSLMYKLTKYGKSIIQEAPCPIF